MCFNVLIVELYFLILREYRNVCSVYCPDKVAKEITVAAVVYSKPNGGVCVCVSKVSVCLKTSVPLVMLTQQQLLLL